MSEVDDRFVKIGLWTNWSHGYVLGQILTVNARTGTLLIALLTILSSIATAQLWTLLTFLCHQSRANGEPADGLFWQHQALLRTLPSPTALIADGLKLSWTWRSKVPRAFLRSSILIATALLFAVAAIAAGISTSFTINNSNIEVLVDSPYCGRFNYSKIYNNRTSSTLLAAIEKSIDTYAFNCYQNTSEVPTACRNIFSTPRIGFSTHMAPCPWNQSMCLGSDLPALAMDSGMLDLRTHFGLNSQPEDTVKFRRKVTCNVLPTENHVVVRDVSYWTTRKFTSAKTALEYGSYRNTDPIYRPEATFLQSTVLTEHLKSYVSDGIYGFLHPDKTAIGVVPLPEMQRTDSDLALLAVWFNRVLYETPVEDPLFSAHKPIPYVVGGGHPDGSLYVSDNIAGVVGCAVQYQFCIPQAGEIDFCTPLTGTPLENFTDDFPPLRPIQLRALQLLRSTVRLWGIADSAGKSNVLAQDTINRTISPGLPRNQWIKEVVAWESLVWAGYQTLLSAAIVGPTIFDPQFADLYTESVVDDGDRQLCRSLKVRKSGGFANVNVFALAILLVSSSMLTLCNILILRILIFLSRFRAALAPRIDRWIQDGVFQLQRRAFGARDQGSWIDLEQEIPITVERELLSELAVESAFVSKMSDWERLARKTWRKTTEPSVVEVVGDRGGE